MSERDAPDEALNVAEQRAWRAAAAVPDPELPVVTVADLGILRSVRIDASGTAVARVAPTYAGCPAVPMIEHDIEAALRAAGFEARIERQLAPAWTSDWISPQGRAKLLSHGIAPPATGTRSKRALFAVPTVACPVCGSQQTERLAEFGSTACKAMYRCRACREPFEYFKCL